MILDRYATKEGFLFSSTRYADKAEFKFKGRQLHFIKPSTYMNLSGKAVHYWMTELKIPREHILVLVDDLAIPFGALRLRPKGSAAGHNGLGNIEETLQSQEYARLRFGIGSDFPKGRQVDFVLGKFSDAEQDALPPLLDKAIIAIETFCTVGVGRAMGMVN